MAQFKLPQQDNAEQRAQLLEKWKSDFGSFQYDMGIPMSVKAPEENKPDTAYAINILRSFVKRRNIIEACTKKSGFKFSKPLPKLRTVEFSKVIKDRDLGPLIGYFLPDPGACLPSGRPTSVKDYEKIFVKEPVPDTIKDVDSDPAFAGIFLGGTDPDSLQRMTKVPEKFPITDSHFRSIPQFASDNLRSAVQEGRVFYVDYAIMSELKDGQHSQGPKYLFAPLVALAVPRGGGELTPFAIQTGQSPEGREIYSPKDGWSWRLARSHAQAAANARSGMVSHLALTHLLIEPIAMCVYRNLAPAHPVRNFLQTHIVNTLHINGSAVESLINKDQFVDRMVGSEVTSSHAMLSKFRRHWDFKANYYPSKLERNGTMDNRILKNYAYRDDGNLLWASIKKWVSDYMSFYYRSEADLRADVELQNWAREVSSDKVGQVTNFGSNGGINSIQELIDTVTMIVFTAGPQHACVNFAQKTDMAFVPASPLAGYTPEMKGKGHSEQDWLNFLPPLDVQLVQSTICNFLGSQYIGRLGDYKGLFKDEAIVAALGSFNVKLDEIENTIMTRNKSRRPFVHFLPSKIPPGVNI